MVLFSIKFLEITLFDVLDIIIVYTLFYYLIDFFKGTRALQMVLGLGVILLLSLIASLLNLQTVSWLMNTLRTAWVIAFVIIFQPELRRLLNNLGQTWIIRKFFKKPGSRVLEEIIDSTQELIRRKWGGLFVLTRETKLKSIKAHATELNAEVSSSLLVSIFNPESPLHDGAVLIQSDQIEAAGCILPLSQNPDLEPNMGTRHRAALGMAEESDAIVVVVSEETQKISIAFQGIFYRNLDEDTLRGLLNKLYFRMKED
ncbi:MAG TPA: diadenylate cyclase CdaA [bacterium]|nr:diadenylate cyclase CdaA [bacterium]